MEMMELKSKDLANKDHSVNNCKCIITIHYDLLLYCYDYLLLLLLLLYHIITLDRV